MFDETRQLPSIAEAQKAQRKHPTLGFVGQVLPLCCQRPWNCEVRCGSVRAPKLIFFFGSFGGGCDFKTFRFQNGSGNLTEFFVFDNERKTTQCTTLPLFWLELLVGHARKASQPGNFQAYKKRTSEQQTVYFFTTWQKHLKLRMSPREDQRPT